MFTMVSVPHRPIWPIWAISIWQPTARRPAWRRLSVMGSAVKFIAAITMQHRTSGRRWYRFRIIILISAAIALWWNLQAVWSWQTIWWSWQTVTKTGMGMHRFALPDRQSILICQWRRISTMIRKMLFPDRNFRWLWRFTTTAMKQSAVWLRKFWMQMEMFCRPIRLMCLFHPVKAQRLAHRIRCRKTWTAR